jgi:hypothetical protein
LLLLLITWKTTSRLNHSSSFRSCEYMQCIYTKSNTCRHNSSHWNIQYIQFNSPVFIVAASLSLRAFKAPTYTRHKSRLDTVDWNGSCPVSFSLFSFFISLSLYIFFDPHELSLCVVVVVEYKGYSSLLLLCVPFVRMSSPFEINTTITHPYIHEAVKQANEWMNEKNERMNEYMNEWKKKEGRKVAL